MAHPTNPPTARAFMSEKKWKAVIDRVFSYVHEDRPTEPGEVMPTIIARDLEPEVATLLADAPEMLKLIERVVDAGRPHGSDRFQNPCECDQCGAWDMCNTHLNHAAAKATTHL